MTTNHTNNTTSQEEIDLKLAYNEYTLECAANGTKPQTFGQWSNRGKIFIPGVTNKPNTSAVVATTNAMPKSAVARRIFARHAATGVLVRKNIITEFCSDPLFAANGLEPLTGPGAATYFANITAAYKKDPQAFMDANYVDENASTEEVSDTTDVESEVEVVTSTVNVTDDFDTSDFDTVDTEAEEEAA